MLGNMSHLYRPLQFNTSVPSRPSLPLPTHLVTSENTPQIHPCDSLLHLLLPGRGGHHRPNERHPHHPADPRGPQGGCICVGRGTVAGSKLIRDGEMTGEGGGAAGRRRGLCLLWIMRKNVSCFIHCEDHCVLIRPGNVLRHLPRRVCLGVISGPVLRCGTEPCVLQGQVPVGA